MLLPTGEVLFSPSSNDVQVFTPDGGPKESWRPTVASVDAQVGVLPWLVDSYLVVGTQLNGLSQANTYGDDCYPATNYPLVRLRDLGTNAVTYVRTYDFSTMGVATGAVLQSCKFEPPGVPNGTYELTVVANGISSHGVVFQYRRPRKPEVLEGAVKPVFEIVGKEIAEEFVDRRQWAVDPEIVELRHQVKSLQNSVQRLTTIIAARELPDVGRQIAERAVAERLEGTAQNGEAEVETDGRDAERSSSHTAE